MGKNIKTIDEIRIHNMVDMGLRFSGMMRLYKKGSKQKMISWIEKMLPGISNVVPQMALRNFMDPSVDGQ